MRETEACGGTVRGAGAILRRPAAFGPHPLPVAAHRYGAGLPGFLGRRPGGDGRGGMWRDGDKPVDVGGFDSREDVLSLTFLGSGPLPALSLRQDEAARLTTLLANGKPIAVLRNAGPEFSLANVAAVLRAR